MADSQRAGPDRPEIGGLPNGIDGRMSCSQSEAPTEYAQRLLVLTALVLGNSTSEEYRVARRQPLRLTRLPKFEGSGSKSEQGRQTALPVRAFHP